LKKTKKLKIMRKSVIKNQQMGVKATKEKKIIAKI